MWHLPEYDCEIPDLNEYHPKNKKWVPGEWIRGVDNVLADCPRRNPWDRDQARDLAVPSYVAHVALCGPMWAPCPHPLGPALWAAWLRKRCPMFVVRQQGQYLPQVYRAGGVDINYQCELRCAPSHSATV